MTRENIDKQTELRKVLEELIEAIDKLENCLPYLLKLDHLRSEFKVDPRLAHFLEKRSYEKALLYLKEEAMALGRCEK